MLLCFFGRADIILEILFTITLLLKITEVDCSYVWKGNYFGKKFRFVSNQS